MLQSRGRNSSHFSSCATAFSPCPASLAAKACACRADAPCIAGSRAMFHPPPSTQSSPARPRTAPISLPENFPAAESVAPFAGGNARLARIMTGNKVPRRCALTSNPAVKASISAQASAAARIVDARDFRAEKARKTRTTSETATTASSNHPPSLASQSQLLSGCKGRRSNIGSKSR